MQKMSPRWGLKLDNPKEIKFKQKRKTRKQITIKYIYIDNIYQNDQKNKS